MAEKIRFEARDFIPIIGLENHRKINENTRTGTWESSRGLRENLKDLGYTAYQSYSIGIPLILGLLYLASKID